MAQTPIRTYWIPAILVLAVLASATWFLAAERRIAGQWGFSLDDSWIYATFARNLATGHGYSFNPGERISGATGPLYVFVLALLYALSGDIVVMAKVFGVICLSATSVLTYFAMRNLDPRSRVKPFLVGLLVGISPSLIWSALSGMEIPLYLLIASLGIYFCTLERWNLAVLCWSVGVWVRPDGLLLVLVGIFVHPRPRGIGARALAALPAVAAFFAFNYLVGGTVLPNSVLVKSHPGVDVWASIWRMVQQWAPLWGLSQRSGDFSPHAIVLLPALIVGAVHMARRFPALGVYTLTVPLAFALVGVPSGSHGRYLMPTLPFGILLAVAGMGHLVKRLPRERRSAGLAALAIVCVAWQVAALHWMGDRHGWNVENINHMQRLLAEEVRDNTSAGDTIAVNDVGAMGYFSGCYVVDLVGLVSRPRPFPENLKLFRPKYVVIFPNWYQSYLAVNPRTKRTMFYDADSTLKYAPIAGAGLLFNTICARDQMFVYARLEPGQEGPTDIKMAWH